MVKPNTAFINLPRGGGASWDTEVFAPVDNQDAFDEVLANIGPLYIVGGLLSTGAGGTRLYYDTGSPTGFLTLGAPGSNQLPVGVNATGLLAT